MRRALSLTGALLLAGGLSAPAFVQAQVTIGHEMTNQDLNTAELEAFDRVATSNLKMSRRLTANPRLANNDNFLKRWRDLNNFFSKYPGSKERFLKNPGNYLAGVHMHHGHPMMAKKPAAPQTKSEAAPAEAAPPAAPAAAPAAPAAPPAAPSTP